MSKGLCIFVGVRIDKILSILKLFMRALKKKERVVRVFDKDGYDQFGYDVNGYNRSGYNRYGLDCYGYNEWGYDEHGYNIYGEGEVVCD